MNPMESSSLARVQKLSRVFRVVCWILLVLLAMLAISVTVPQIQTALYEGRMVVTAITMSLLGHLYWAVAVFLLERLFRNFSRHGFFHRDGVRLLKWLGILFVGAGFFQGFMTTAMAASNREVLPYVLTSFFSMAAQILLGLFLLMLSWVMKEACDLKTQQSLTV
jgi:hypothetical protein